jgi:hypothetical protein
MHERHARAEVAETLQSVKTRLKELRDRLKPDCCEFSLTLILKCTLSKLV